MARTSIAPPLERQQDRLLCRGDWTIYRFHQLSSLRQRLSGTITTIDAQHVTQLDTAGAWLLRSLCQQFPQANLQLSPQHQHVLRLLERFPAQKTERQTQSKPSWLARLGQATCQALHEGFVYLAFIGELSHFLWLWLRQPQRILWQSIWQTVQRTGFDALGIVGLLSFLVGIVLAYQMGGQLQSYGANIYIVNLLGISILREFGPLITAIIVAGRSGSAFAAALGTMQVHQEIDALKTLGVSPLERLAVSKVLGLTIALPLLVVWANFTALVGGLIMAKFQLGISPHAYLSQFHSSIKLSQLWLGLLKTPAFAVIIASVGCLQGLLVRGGADSVGQQTTKSVVQAIFLIIVADAFFSIVLSALHV